MSFDELFKSEYGRSGHNLAFNGHKWVSSKMSVRSSTEIVEMHKSLAVDGVWIGFVKKWEA